MTARVEWNGKAFETHLMDELKVRAETAAEHLRSEVVKTLSRRQSRDSGPAPAGQPPGVDTGRLRNSIAWQVRTGSEKVTIIVGTNVIYGRILELGGVIRPRKAKMLSVPISDEARRHRGSPRKFRGKLVIMSRPGRPPLLIQAGRKGPNVGKRTKIHYVLVRKVTIKPHPYLRPTWAREQQRVLQIMGAKA